MSYKSGDYLVICDRCGFKRYASECKMTWDGWFVCSDTCWEPKHEQFNPPKPLGEAQSIPINRAPKDYNMIESVNEETLISTVTIEAPNDGYFLTSPITGDDL